MRNRFRRYFNGIKSKTSHMPDDDPPSKLPTLLELESVIPKSTPDIGGVWQSKLLPDIILYVLEEFLENERATVAALSSTCRSMYTICLPKRYNQVTLNSRNRISPTSIEAFAHLAAHRPHILSLIQRLTFLDDGFMFQGSRPITIEEECLCYILTRRLSYAKLKRLDLSFRVVWDRLPPPVKSACLDIFSITSLDHISFHYMAIPANVLGRLSKISTLEMKGEVRTFIPHELQLPDDRTMWCAPKRLIIWDTSHTGFTTTNMLHKQSGLLLSSLEHLEARVSDPHFALLEAPLASCRHSLTHLELHCPRSMGSILCRRCGGFADRVSYRPVRKSATTIDEFAWTYFISTVSRLFYDDLWRSWFTFDPEFSLDRRDNGHAVQPEKY
ncbi:hypothetical protein BJ165DRAFT_1471788 [Panaeolus papilionaceus]|nr:hypothetical protein BJ165DRAFT_1471788 [Panaeolus papilionaceus]